MLSLKQIESFYPEKERYFPRNMYREYLQYKILEIIFSSAESAKLSFLGGTCLRIVHESGRFSEDLDFDNFGLTEKDFANISALVKEKLEYEGYNVETKNVSKGAYRCYLRIPGILFSEGLSSHVDEKILIQPDSASHGFEYKPDIYLLNKFDVTARINVTPPDILLSRKISAVFGRKTPKGRDFYDITFLLAKTAPNYEYLRKKMNVSDGGQLRDVILKKCDTLDFNGLAKDVGPFLIDKGDVKKILLFRDVIEKIR